MATVSGNSVLEDEELVDEIIEYDSLGFNDSFEDDLLTTEEDMLDNNSNSEVVDVSGNSSGTTSLPSDEIPAVTFPEEITLSNEQFEALIAKQDELNQNLQVNTFMTCLLLGVLIGIIFVRGLSNFVRGV